MKIMKYRIVIAVALYYSNSENVSVFFLISTANMFSLFKKKKTIKVQPIINLTQLPEPQEGQPEQQQANQSKLDRLLIEQQQQRNNVKHIATRTR